MGYHLNVVDLDHTFQTLNAPPVIVNDMDLTTVEEKEKFNSIVATQYDGDYLSSIPSCDCGKIKGEYLLGMVCEDCGYEVAHHTDRDMDARVWITTPEGVDTLISPIAWMVLHSHLKQSGTNFLEWLINPNYKPNNPDLPALNRLKSYGFARGLNAFHRQFDDIMLAVNEIGIVKSGAEDFFGFMHIFRDRIFCKALPIPSKVAFVTEKTNIADYADSATSKTLEAIRTISSIKTSIKPLTLKQKEVLTVKTIMYLTDYHDTVFRELLAKKPGWLRKHTYGSRSHFTFRGVITSITNIHDPNHIYLPWTLAVNLLKVHITNKLLRRGFNPMSASSYIVRHLNTYSKLMDDILQELIAEAPGDGLGIIWQRNPSLRRGSKQYFTVPKVKTDPRDLTVSMSVLVLKAPNADFDGRFKLPSLNLFNCWKLLRGFLTTSNVKTVTECLTKENIGQSAAKLLYA